MSVFIVDTNFFIQAHRVTYPMDIVSGFWEKDVSLAGKGKIASIDKVKREFYDNEDDLKQWRQSRLPNDFFRKTTGVIESYASVVNWANLMNGHYLPKALNEFFDADIADAWLVAYAFQTS